MLELLFPAAVIIRGIALVAVMVEAGQSVVDHCGPALVLQLPGGHGLSITILKSRGHVLRYFFLNLVSVPGGEGCVVLQKQPTVYKVLDRSPNTVSQLCEIVFLLPRTARDWW